MKIMITGARGFIGSAMKDLIVETSSHYWTPGMEIKPSKNSHRFVSFDLMDRQDIRRWNSLNAFIRKEKPDVILHLAAIARFADADRDPILAWETNVLGTQNVVDNAKHFDLPLIYASTGSAIMPLDNYEPPYDETIPPRGNSQYGCTKAAGERIVATHSPHIILRYAHIYGREKRLYGLVGAFVDRIQRGLKPQLYGGAQTNDFIYVKDVARANLLAAEAEWPAWNQTYNVGTGVELSAYDAGKAVCEAMNHDCKMQIVSPRTVDAQKFSLDVQKASRMLDFQANYSFYAGLDDMMRA